MKKKKKLPQRIDIRVFRVTKVEIRNQSKYFDATGVPVKGVTVFLEIHPDAMELVKFRLISISSNGEQEEIDYGFLSQYFVPTDRNQVSYSIDECPGYIMNWKIHCQVIDEIPVIACASSIHKAIEPGPLYVEPVQVESVETEKASIELPLVNEDKLVEENKEDKEIKTFKQLRLTGSKAVLTDTINIKTIQLPSAEYMKAFREKYLPKAEEKKKPEKIIKMRHSPLPDEVMKYELQTRSEKVPKLITFASEFCKKEDGTLDFSVPVVSEAFHAWMQKNKASVVQLMEYVGLNQTEVYNILWIKYLHPELKKLLAPPTLHKDALPIYLAGLISRINEQLHLRIWETVSKQKNLSSKVRIIHELGEGRVLEKNFSCAPPRIREKRIPRRMEKIEKQEKVLEPIPEPRMENLVLSELEKFAVDSVCIEYQVSLKDLRMCKSNGNAVNPIARRAQQALSVILYDKLQIDNARGRLIEIMNGRHLGSFYSIHSCACRSYLSLMDFKEIVDRITQQIKDTFGIKS